MLRNNSKRLFHSPLLHLKPYRLPAGLKPKTGRVFQRQADRQKEGFYRYGFPMVMNYYHIYE